LTIYREAVEFFLEKTTLKKMTIKVILEIENANTDMINLFKEGIFWRVYQKSAYYFVRHIKELKVLKKFYKIVNCEVVYAGFPDTILPQIQELAQSKWFKFEKCNEKHCAVSGVAVDNGFEEWKNSIKIQVPVQSNKNYVSTNLDKRKEVVIEKLKGYSLANHTPIEIMALVMELQKELAVFKPE